MAYPGAHASKYVIIFALAVGLTVLFQPALCGGPEHQSQVKGGEHAEGGSEAMKEVLEHEVVNTPYIHVAPLPKIPLPQFAPVTIAGITIDFSITRHLVYLWIASILTVLLMWIAARQNRKRKVPRGWGNLVESVVQFIRDEIAQPILGDKYLKYMPILLSFFFLISFLNVLGLVPFGALATANISVTGGLTIVSFCVTQIAGVRAHGPFGYLFGLVPKGIPAVLWPLMFVIELIGIGTKFFALCIRLFANMLSGGLVIGAFYGLIFGLHSLAVAPLSLAFLLFMMLLKLFISLLQAYIFTILTAFFVAIAVSHH